MSEYLKKISKFPNALQYYLLYIYVEHNRDGPLVIRGSVLGRDFGSIFFHFCPIPHQDHWWFIPWPVWLEYKVIKFCWLRKDCGGQEVDVYGPLTLIYVNTYLFNCRSLVSKLVDSCDIGKIFALIAMAETVSNLIGSLVFTNLYGVTYHIYPGLTYFIMAALYVVMEFVLIWPAIQMIQSSALEDTSEEIVLISRSTSSDSCFQEEPTP